MNLTTDLMTVNFDYIAKIKYLQKVGKLKIEAKFRHRKISKHLLL